MFEQDVFKKHLHGSNQLPLQSEKKTLVENSNKNERNNIRLTLHSQAFYYEEGD